MTALNRWNPFREMGNMLRPIPSLMKNTRVTLLAPCLFIVGVLIGFTGCATTPYNEGSSTVSALNSAAGQTAVLSTKITDALGALNSMSFASQGDLRDPYGKFTDAVKNLQTAYKDLGAKMAAVQSRATAYLNHWNKQSSLITSENLRSISLEQQNDVSTNLAAVTVDYKAVKHSFMPFMSHLKNIKTFLSTDLTPDGLNAIKGHIARTQAEANPLRNSLQQLQSHLSALANTMSPVISDDTP